MTVAALNNVSTADAYTDTTTVVFAYPRPSFSAQVYNAGICYQLGIVPPTGRDIVWEGMEHFTAPALLSFNDATAEGFPDGSKFMGIRVRSYAPGVPASVTVA